MAAAGKKAATPPPKKRRVLTDDERIAQMEADIKKVRERKNTRLRDRHRDLSIRKSSLIKRRDGLNVEIEAIEKDMAVLVEQLPGGTGSVVSTSDKE